MGSTDIAAWWGAVVASLVLFWDVYKWKAEGPRLTMRLSPNMNIFGDPLREGKKWVTVTVSNIGNRPTTIKSVGMEYHSNWLNRLRNRAEKAVVYTNPNDHFPLPRLLNPGDEWVGLIPQERLDKWVDLEDMSRTGHVMIWLS
ncbi:MAG: hypothetical protein HY283_01355 [Nitrospirae bacterium]|nr:hypothetical protein [Nitrospirota bacterium]